MAEVTDDEIIDIANGFLLSSPPGEFMEVVTDVRALLPKESLINESAPRTFREYNTEQMVQVDSPKGHKVLITKYGEVADGEYLDPKGGLVLFYDHIKQEVTGSRGIQSGDMENNMENLRVRLRRNASLTLESITHTVPPPCTERMARSSSPSLRRGSIPTTFGMGGGAPSGLITLESSWATSRSWSTTMRMEMFS